MTFPKPERPVHRARRLPRALVTLGSALALGAGLLGAGLAAPAGALAGGSLPACRYDDILTTPRAYTDWSQILVDTILRVPQTYVPPDLVSVNVAGIGGAGQVRALVIPDLTAMTAAAKANGTPIAVQSAYRSYATQITTFQYWVNLSGYKQALLYSARPGHSEHQLGVAIDFKSAAGGPPWSGSDWGTSPAGAWMKAHAWEYGFIQSYPKGKVKTTCYDYESWHFRYVGIDEAAAIHASGLTIREYLWSHFTTAIVPGTSGGSTGQPPTKAPTVAPSAVPSEPPAVPPTTAPGTAAPAASLPSQGSVATSAPAATSPPASPAGALGPGDPGVLVALAAIVVVLLALLASLAMGRRKGAAMGRSGGSGAGLSG
ncbi:MAG TPA: M15 family metallopeptidase [Candidatus Limnocylindrales bacterium]